MNRDRIERDCPEDFREQMGEILDHIEGRVNSAKQLLENIRDVSSLGNVEDCLSELNALSRDLY